MNVASLFSGVCGLDLGIKLAVPDARVVAYVERDAFCQRIIRARIADGWLDDAPIFDDVRTFPPAGWSERVDLVCGGWPCQPFSLAGKRAGTADERHLWPEVARIVGVCRPHYVFGENVPGFISLGLGECLADLAALGFDAEWTTVRASDVGAPHRRERVFILGYAVSERSDNGRNYDEQELRFRESVGQHWTWTPSPMLAHARRCGDGAIQHEPWTSGTETNACVGLSSVADAEGRSEEWAQGQRPTARAHSGRGCSELPLFPPGPADADGWRAVLDRWPELAPATETQPTLRGVDDGTAPRMAQLRALGNAVVPLQAATALRILAGRLDDG